MAIRFVAIGFGAVAALCMGYVQWEGTSNDCEANITSFAVIRLAIAATDVRAGRAQEVCLLQLQDPPRPL